MPPFLDALSREPLAIREINEAIVYVWYANLSYTGQFWNVPVSVNKYEGPLQPGYESFFNRDILYLITVTSVTGRGTRSFLGELHDIAWDQRTGWCIALEYHVIIYSS